MTRAASGVATTTSHAPATAHPSRKLAAGVDARHAASASASMMMSGDSGSMSDIAS
jgi:hypothetical protein